jgi:hypothetical protein
MEYIDQVKPQQNTHLDLGQWCSQLHKNTMIKLRNAFKSYRKPSAFFTVCFWSTLHQRGENEG